MIGKMGKKRYHLTATAFDRKGRIIGFGTNDYKRSHPLMKYHAVLAGESESKIYRHAELAALLDAGQHEVHSVFVQRLDAAGNEANAKPCKTCQSILKSFGVKVASFTTETGPQALYFDGDN